MIDASKFELKHLVLVLSHIEYERLVETLATMPGSFESDLLLILTCPEKAVRYSNDLVMVLCRPEVMRDEIITSSHNVSNTIISRAKTSISILSRRSFIQSLIDFLQNSKLDYSLNVMYVMGKQTYIIQMGDMDASDIYNVQTKLTFNTDEG